MSLPIELILQILIVNLSPRNPRVRTDNLFSYCLLNKYFLSVFQPKLLEHINLEGGGVRIALRLGMILHFVAVKGEEVTRIVKTISVALDHSEMEQGDSLLVSKKVMQLVEQCERITELALVGLARPLNLRDLLAKLPRLRVLHIKACPVIAWPEGEDDIDAESLQYLAVGGGTNFPASVMSRLTELRGISDDWAGTTPADWMMNPGSEPKSSKITSLRLSYDVLGAFGPSPAFDPSSISANVTSLEIVNCLAIDGIWRWRPFPSNLVRLNATALPVNFQFLTDLVDNREITKTRLKHIGFHPVREEEEEDWGSAADDEWRIPREELRVACEKHGVHLQDRMYCQSAMEFWEECTGENFVLTGFVDGFVDTDSD